MGERLGICLISVLFAVACDTKATASDPQGGGYRAEQKSREYESCSASMLCQDDLRCFDNVCRRTTRSNVGDYYAALGAAARTRGELDAAIDAYAQAIGQYEAEKVAGGVPPDVDCAYGAALAAARAKKQHAELAARVLHRCVLSVPAGSALRDQALVQLATLAEAGLDPILLGAGKTADVYLTKPAARRADKLAVSVTAAPQPAKTFPTLQAALGTPEVRAGLVKCWEASKKDALAVTVPVKTGYVPSEYEDVPGAWVSKIEPLPAGADPAEACAREVVDPVVKALKLNERFETKLTVTLK